MNGREVGRRFFFIVLLFLFYDFSLREDVGGEKDGLVAQVGFGSTTVRVHRYDCRLTTKELMYVFFLFFFFNVLNLLFFSFRFYTIRIVG